MENPKEPNMHDRLKSIHDQHEEQFNIAINAALQRGFGRWFDDTWMSAKANGALPNPFLSSMFVFITTILLKKFVGGLPATLPLEEKERLIMEAKELFRGYLDQIEGAAVQDVYAPKPATTHAEPRCPECLAPLPCKEHDVTSKGKQTIILPKKKVLM